MVSARVGEGLDIPSEGTEKCPAGYLLCGDWWLGGWTNNLYLHTSTLHQFALGSKRPRARVGFMEGDDE